METNREDRFLSVLILASDSVIIIALNAVCSITAEQIRGYVDHGGYDRAKLYAFDHGADAWRDRRVAAAY